MNKFISLVVPAFNEQESLPLFYEIIVQITNEMKKTYSTDFEFIFVDDGSNDETINMVKDFRKLDSRVKYISFSRNFGKESAMYAGLKYASGDYVVLIDADLQHPPEFLPRMYEAVDSGRYDCAATRRVNRKGESKIRSLFSSFFYKLINMISETNIVEGCQDYRFMSRKMVDSVLQVVEYNRFSKGIFSWVGFDTLYIEYENVERVVGKTKWSFWKLFLYSLDGIFAFSTMPLSISFFMGIVFCFLSILIIIIVLLKTLIWGDPVAGFPTLICCMFLIGGIQLFCVGIVGQYLAKTYLETKQRPIYIIKETDGDE